MIGRRITKIPTWTTIVMVIGRRESGKFRMLKSDKETKALSAVRTFSDDTRTKVAKDASEI